MPHVVIIGGGIGGAIAHDLTLRGFKVTLLEKGSLLCGATGRHHGLLHSGARYALHDVETARECIEENRIIRKLAPEALEQNNGLFLALNEQDRNHLPLFLENCKQAGIPTKEIAPDLAIHMEPNIHPDIQAAVQVPDATMDAWRLAMHFFATAQVNGADIRPFNEVTGIHVSGGKVKGVKVRDHGAQDESSIDCDMLVNAAGAWAGRVAGFAGVRLPLGVAPGVMVAVSERLANGVINRLHTAGESDIIVPQRRLSILGASIWLTEDPDGLEVPQTHIRQMVTECTRLVPKVAATPIHSAWSAPRPLFVEDAKAQNPMTISRGFAVFDHAVDDGPEGFLSVLGGKATTMRAMAEKTSNLICEKTNCNSPCMTRVTNLVNYRDFFKKKVRSSNGK